MIRSVGIGDLLCCCGVILLREGQWGRKLGLEFELRGLHDDVARKPENQKPIL